ncbi:MULTISPECIES: ABC transporter substrate-binding protein [unclassified Paenibacillus]|uniref:ABC transporter substrate-binding protein n=1 Tax=unclassified Paenibacillus TaxID=185978 RepID=UPI000953FEE7|nr:MULTISPECIES: ABC transporter substrate-binding protein [unclassified Paenibacillus]ASS65307.1 SgrR family transcriptional regulator [Paenibacillus sp. RUD330]SIQ40456.1 DNA-binding transcriptional regulator SgrR of sgrS sRNA, contains a MarR-type HTH domain and a solute-binding domain [Paenibacillus sp. RU4X]SIQ62632.1 DNA-binding transcriptional regulator SgrR of sgrS sRNA, contains a MarR-type HTH domain and a solute-binding domain [Paenibacillus sp. RU4T]
MLNAERYLLLLNRFQIEEPDTEAETALDELAELFHCTERNVKLIVRKLEEEGWIRWIPGKGRGNLSKISFLKSRERFLLDIAKELASDGDYQKAFQLLQIHGEHTSVRDRFVEWLSGHFGSDRIEEGSPAQRDVFRLPVYRPPYSLDPGKLFFAFDSHLIHQIFDRLLGFEADTKSLVPGLAHYWESNDSATAWTFHLRKGVRFHHGRELNASDVCFTLSRLADGQPNRFLMESVEAITALDSRTVRISLNKPNRLLPRLLCSGAASILPADLVQEDESRYWTLPSGTGPFRVDCWTSDRIDLSVHELYYQGRAYLDEVQIAFMPEDIPPELRLKWGQIMASDSRMASKDEQGWGMIRTVHQGCTLLSWNRLNGGPQQSLAFRQAVGLSMDRVGMIGAGGELSYPAYGFFPVPGAELAAERYEPDTAIRMLQEDGYDGAPIKLLTTNQHAKEALWIKDRCGELGIPVDIRCEPHKIVHTSDIVKEADCILMSLVMAEEEVGELETYLQEHSYIRQHLDPALERWIRRVTDAILASDRRETRRTLFNQIEQRLIQEGQVLFLQHRSLNTYVHPSVRGIGINTFGWMDFKDIWLVSDNPV